MRNPAKQGTNSEMSADNNNPPGSGSIESPPSEFPVPGHPLPSADDPHRALSTEH
jgi:hypothetical protein